MRSGKSLPAAVLCFHRHSRFVLPIPESRSRPPWPRLRLEACGGPCRPRFDSLPPRLIAFLTSSFVFIDILGSFVEKTAFSGSFQPSAGLFSSFSGRALGIVEWQVSVRSPIGDKSRPLGGSPNGGGQRREVERTHSRFPSIMGFSPSADPESFAPTGVSRAPLA